MVVVVVVVVVGRMVVVVILFVETKRHTYYELADTPYPRRASLKSVHINLNNNIFYDHVDIA